MRLRSPLLAALALGGAFLAALLLPLVLGSLSLQRAEIRAGGGLDLGLPPVSAAPALQGTNSSCRDDDPETGDLLSTRVISPSEILACETAAVSMTLRASCAAVPMHVMINIDRSGSMVGQPLRDAQRAAAALIDGLDMRENPDVRVGVVSHGDPPVVDLRPTNSASRARGRINGLQAGGEDNLPRSIDQARSELVKARRDVEHTPVEAMVILSDGGQTYPPAQAIAPAGAAKGEGILVVSVCLDNGFSDCRTMRRLASSGRYYFETRQTGQLERIFREIADELRDIGLRSVSVSETLPSGLTYVPDSGMPEPDSVSEDGRTLNWTLSFVGKEGSPISYTVAPEAPADYVLAASDITYRDSRNGLGALRMPTETLRVPAPCEVPSPTPTVGPTPTNTPVDPPTPTSTPTPTPTATPTPTPTATPVPDPIFLPILNPSRCVDKERPADIALVLDASTSMHGASGAGRSKMAAAREAAHGFVEGMRAIDRVAIVSFNGGSRLEAPLTADTETLHQAIDGIENAPGTRIDLALREATAALAPEALREDAKGVIVLLTDGLHGGAPIQDVHDAAAAAQARATVFTIGVGPDVDAELLAEIAGDPERYYGVADAEALSSIYEAIRERIACERAMPEVKPVGQ